VILKEVLFPC